MLVLEMVATMTQIQDVKTLVVEEVDQVETTPYNQGGAGGSGIVLIAYPT